jgi:hypothetical protein
MEKEEEKLKCGEKKNLIRKERKFLMRENFFR